MKWTGSLSILLLLLLLTSCGERSGNGKKIISLDEVQLARLVNDQTFECESNDGNKCPKGIGRLVIFNTKNPNESALCSGFLVGQDTLITNNHCVSNELECKNTYISIYNGDTVEKVRCGTLLHTEIDNRVLKKKKVDYTILKLDREVEVTPFTLAQDKLVVGDALTAWVVDHLSLSKVRITELNCDHDKEEISIQLKNCPVIEGNSGSPLLNSQSEVVGVIWGSTVDETITAHFPLVERRKLNEFAFATSVEFFRDLIDLR